MSSSPSGGAAIAAGLLMVRFRGGEPEGRGGRRRPPKGAALTDEQPERRGWRVPRPRPDGACQPGSPRRGRDRPTTRAVALYALSSTRLTQPRTRGRSAIRSTGAGARPERLRHVTLIAPGREEPSLVGPLLEAELRWKASNPRARSIRSRAAPAARTVHDDRGLLSIELPDRAREDRVQRDVDRAVDPPRVPLVVRCSRPPGPRPRCSARPLGGREVGRQVALAGNRNPSNEVRNDGSAAKRRAPARTPRTPSRPNRTNRTCPTEVSARRTAPIATSAASPSGYPKIPVEIAGNATVVAPSSSATRSDSVWHEASSAGAVLDLEYTGPTVWITQRAGRLPAVVATACPVGRPSGKRDFRISVHPRGSPARPPGGSRRRPRRRP